jgi:hypothetical protein
VNDLAVVFLSDPPLRAIVTAQQWFADGVIIP